MYYLEDNDLLVDTQNGFRRKRSCLDHIFSLTSIIRNRQSQGQNTFVAFIDMEKAFDRVDRNLMMYKLWCCNIDGNMYKTIKSIYSNPLCCVNVNGKNTNWFDISYGVRQGDTLSPTLFSIFVNDLAHEIDQLNLRISIDDITISILLYADDIVLIAETEKNLQIMLDQVYKYWCNRWNMNVNIAKSQIIHFRKKLSLKWETRIWK